MAENFFKLDNIEFNDKTSLADYLKRNFKKSISYLSDDTLYALLKEQFPELYHRVIELSKEYENQENILTLIIYLLDNNAGINTPNYHFNSNYDIANEMKKTYPVINQEIKALFYDQVLLHIYWNEYNRTYDARYKRNYTFMLRIYENRMHEFAYYYFLFLHLAKNEVVRFTFDGLKMKSLVEINIHLSLNIDRSTILIEELLNNPFIIALMAIESGIESVSAVLCSKQTMEILKLLEAYGNVDLIPIMCRKIAYWLIRNYQNYTYESDEAKALQTEYVNLTKNLKLNTLSDYIAIYDEVNALYKRFVNLFNHNKLISFRSGIRSEDDYYLNYRYNEDYVCKQFLLENGIYDAAIHTDIHRDSVEREVLVDVLEVEKKEIEDFRVEVASLTTNVCFDKKFLGKKLFVSAMYVFLAVISLIGSFFLVIISKDLLSDYVNLGLLCLLSISIVLFVLCIIKYSQKLADAELVEVALDNSLNSIEEICKEEALILNPSNKEFDDLTFNKLSTYRKNRKNDLTKIKKISAKKTSVSNGLLIAAISIVMIPVLQYGLSFALQMFNVIPFELSFGLEFNFIPLIFTVINLVLLIILRKKGYAYYFVYLYMIIIAVLSLII